MMFLNPKNPVATCESDSCDDCAINGNLHCHFSLKDWVHFLFIAFPSFLLGGAGIYHISGWMVIFWLFIIVGYFNFVEIRVMCSHCPHYAEEGRSLKCWANYGSPKLWKYRPGPMTIVEKTIFLGGFAIVWGYPLPFLIIGKQLFISIVYSITTIGFFLTLINFMCSQCMNFACPLNCVDEKVRDQFFYINPTVAEAWGKSGNKTNR